MTGSSRLQQLSAAVFAVVLAVSMFAPAVGAASASPAAADASGHAPSAVGTAATVQDTGTSVQFSPDDANASSGSSSSDGGSDGVLADGLEDASGETQVVVRLSAVRPDAGVSAQAAVNSLKTKAQAAQEPVTAWAADNPGVSVVKQFWLANAVLLEVDTGQADLAALGQIEGVQRVHPNYEFSIPEPERAPASLDNASEYNVTYGLDQINATEVWSEYDTMGDGAKIAVLDTGVHDEHPDIQIEDENFVKIEADGSVNNTEPYDSSYHGTHTSGTVVGQNNSGMYIGVAPNATLMHGLVIPGGSGSFARIIGGMQWAVEENADVISMSLGATGHYPAMIEPVLNAHDAGTIVVSSAGNSYEGTSGSPANVYDAYAIGASNENRDIADFSSGETVDTSEAWGIFAPDYWPDEYIVPDVSAPGVDVVSAIPPGTIPSAPDAIYGVASGTSMAAPHVSGAIALMQSAAGEDLTIEQIKTALTTTATKPADAPDEKDVRYGEGIIDVAAATDRVAAPSGVTGTVTDADGDPVEGATVMLGEYPTTTNADGEYTLHADDGTYEVTVEAFGYESVSREVTVSNGSFVTENFTLTGELAAEITAGQPDGVADGESFEVTANVAGVQSLTVTQVGNYSGTVTLDVMGEEYAPGDTIEFDSPVSGELTITVETSADGSGHLELAHTFAGAGDSIEVTTGPTVVFEEWVDVAVVDLENSNYGDNIAEQLKLELHPRFRFSHVTPEEALDAAEDGDYDAYLVQNLGTDNDELVGDFVDETKGPGTGVVYLDQFGPGSNAIERLSAATGDPANAADAATGYPDTVRYDVTADSPVLDGVAEEGDVVDLYTPPASLFAGSFHSYFEDYEGAVSPETVAETQVTACAGYYCFPTSENTGSGLAVDTLSRTVLAASLGQSSYVGPLTFQDAALELLANSVEHTAQPLPVDGYEMPADRVDPGQAINASFQVSNLEQVNVDIADSSGLTADDLGLYINGKVNAFGEWRAYDPAYNGTLNVTVTTDADINASDVTLEVSMEFADGATLTDELPRTAVYEPPLMVPSEVESIDDAVNVAISGEEIVVADGEYTELSDQQDGVSDIGVWVDKSGLTIRAAENATPQVVLPQDALGSVIRVTSPGVTIDGLNVNADVDDVAPHKSFDYGVELAGTSDVTLRDLDVSGLTGVRFESDVTDVDVSNVRTYDAGSGVGTSFSATAVSDISIDDLTAWSTSGYNDGVYIRNAQNVSVTDSTFHLGEADAAVYNYYSDSVEVANVTVYGGGDATGFDVYGGDDLTFRNSTVTNASTAVDFGSILGEGYVVHGNEITDSDVGVTVDTGIGATITENVIDADVGVEYGSGIGGHEPGLVSVQYNDLSGTDTPFHLTTEVVDGADMDARLNYVGERNASDAIVDNDAETGGVMYDPFLTAPPSEVDTEETTQIGTDLRMDAGEMYAVGVPGPASGTLSEMLSMDFEGAVYGWSADSQSWEMLTGNDSVSALDAVLVSADTDGRMTMNFQSGADSPSSPGLRGVQTGWNFIASPQYTSANDAFDVGSADPSLMLSMFAEPDSQLGPKGEVEGTYEFSALGENPSVSAFGGYFVYVEDDGTIPSYLYNDVTVEQLYDELGLEYEPAASADASASASIAAVLDATENDSEAATHVAHILEHRIEDELGDRGDVTRDDVASVASTVVENAKANTPADANDVIDAAAGNAVASVLADYVDASVVSAPDDDQQDETDSGASQDALTPVAPTPAAA